MIIRLDKGFNEQDYIIITHGKKSCCITEDAYTNNPICLEWDESWYELMPEHVKCLKLNKKERLQLIQMSLQNSQLARYILNNLEVLK